MNIAKFSVNRPVLITMLLTAMVMIGAILLPALPVDLLPELQLPMVVVVTSYPGATPAEVEKLITQPIENIVSTVNNVDKIQSLSQTGSSMVLIHMNWGTNMDKAQLDIQKQVDRISGMLPEGANKPLVLTINPNSFPVMILGVTGDMPLDQLQKLAEEQIVPSLKQADGVASAVATGGPQKEIQVILDANKLTEYGLTPGLIAQTLASSNLMATAGSVERGDKELAIRFDAEMNNVEEIKTMAISLPSGGTVRLEDLADVSLTHARQSQLAFLNGQQVVQVQVMKASGGNTVKVSKEVYQQLDELKASLPDGVKVTPIFDQAVFINKSIRNVVEHGLLGGAIAVLILFLFLADWRTTLVVALMLPISVIATFTFMAASGESLNILSLGGLLIGMGSLVDFAVVVIESIHRYRMRGSLGKEAATLGAGEVTAAVTASALAQIAVFFPMLFAGGLATELFGPMALAVIFSHVAAWFGAITFVPMLAARLGSLPASSRPRRSSNPLLLFGRGIERLEVVYRHLLEWTLRRRWLVIISSLLIFVASLGLIPLIGAEFIPQTDQGQAVVSVELPPSAKLSETRQVVQQLEEVLFSYPEVDLVSSTVGGSQETAITGISSTNTASLTVMMKPREERGRTTQEVMNDFYERTRDIPGVVVNVNTQGSAMGTSGLEVNIAGPDLDGLKELTEEATAAISRIPGLTSVDNNLQASRPEVAVYIDRQKASQHGISPLEMQAAIETAFGGRTVTRIRDGEDEYNVRLMFPDTFRQEYGHLEDLTLRSATGALVRLGDVAEVVSEGRPVSITRSDGQRQALITARLTGERSLGEVSADVQRVMEQLQLPHGYAWSFGGETEQMGESFQSLVIAMVLAVLLVYMIMAGQFESFFQPFVIMFCLPPTVVGALLGLATHGMHIGVTAMIGMIMLIGVVMNNAIVLVDYTNTLRRAGYARDQALLQAGPIRLRPILMTMLSTNLVLLPFAYGGGESAEMMAPLAVVVIYGLLVSTWVTLVLIPAVYSLTDDYLDRLRRRFSRRRPIGPQDGRAENGEMVTRQVAVTRTETNTNENDDGGRR